MNLSEIGEQLRRLNRRGKLEKMLAKADDGLPWADLMSVMHWPAMIGIVILVVRLVRGNAAGERVSDGDAWTLIALVFAAVVLKFGSPLLQSRTERLRKKLRRRGLVVPAGLVQANSAFHATANEQWQPGSVLVAFDPAVLQAPAAFAAAAHDLFALKSVDRRTLPPEHARIAWELYHEMGPTASLPVPPELAAGLRGCVLASVMLPPEPLRTGDLLLCLGLSGETSPAAVAMLPAAVLD